jgi:dUTP pyrophosphatase
MSLLCFKITNNAKLPTISSENAAGLDLYSAHDIIVSKHNKACIFTDLSIIIPNGCYGRIAPRSGLAINNFIDVGGGVIDPDYRGNVGIILFNFGNNDFIISKGDRVAQLICEKYIMPKVTEIFTLSASKRGAHGFGSSGK